MYDTLLFLHLLAAFLLAVTVVTYTAVVLGIWLALHLDEYDFFDGWILGAIVLWMAATGLGVRARIGAEDVSAERAPLMHWLRTVAIVGLLVLMIWKPGA